VLKIHNQNKQEQEMNNITLPEMIVEQRESISAHGVLPPDLDNLHLEFQKTLILNNDAKLDGWRKSTTDLLKEYIPFEVSHEEIVKACKQVMGLNSWKEVSFFVERDVCSEFFNMGLKYCLGEKQVHQKEKDFIDGSGIGYLKKYTSRLKVTIEECFDAKYFYKLYRPLKYGIENFVLNLSSIANAIHPGHWTYPAGHGTKFLTAVEVLRDVFHLDQFCYKELLVAACVASMGRSGLLIHFPQDNLAGGKLTTLKEFN